MYIILDTGLNFSRRRMVIPCVKIDASIILDAKYGQRFMKYVTTLRATGYPAEFADFYPRFFWLLRRCGSFTSLWRIRMPDSPDTCGRKPYPERKSCGFKNIRIRVDEAQSCQIFPPRGLI